MTRPPINVETDAPFIAWDALRRRMRWAADEHVTIVGPTGRGKTTLAMELMRRRRYACVIVTKPSDDVLAGRLAADGYSVTSTIPPVSIAPRFALWPATTGIESVPRQKAVIGAALDTMFRQGWRTVLIDETHYVADFLHLAPRLKLWWQQGRSIGSVLVAGFQRPAWVPRDAYSSASHLFLFGTADDTDAKALGGIGGLSSRLIRETVQWLANDPARRHEFVYVGTRTGMVVRSSLPIPEEP